MANLSRGINQAQRTVPLEEVVIPDLWHIYTWLENAGNKEEAAKVLETWHLAHDLLRNIKERYVPK